MVWWRWKGAPSAWRFGYCTYERGQDDLLRMGAWYGDTMGGLVVSASEIEWKPYE